MEAGSRSGFSGSDHEWATALPNPKLGPDLPAQGRSRGIRALQGPLREGPQLSPGKNGKLRLPQGCDLSWESAQRPGTSGSTGPDPAGFPATVPPFPRRAASREWVVGVRFSHPAGPRGWSHTSPAPAPLAAAPGAGRGRQMLGRRRRRQELGRGRSRGARRRARAPLAGPPGPLRTALAGVRRGTGRPGGGCGTDMHSARLDSFLGQLRWELVRLGGGRGS